MGTEFSNPLHIERELSNFKRLEYWLSHTELYDDDKIICADIELVRFGVLTARPSEKKTRVPINTRVLQIM